MEMHPEPGELASLLCPGPGVTVVLSFLTSSNSQHRMDVTLCDLGYTPSHSKCVGDIIDF